MKKEETEQKRHSWMVTVAICAVFLLMMACTMVTGLVEQPTSTPVEFFPAETPVATVTPQPTEDITSGKLQPEAGPGIACFGSFGNGLTCIEDGTWGSYTREDSPLTGDQIKDIAVCPDGRLLVLHTFGISAYDGQSWRSYDSGWGHASGEAVACDVEGGFWVAHFEGVTHFDGARWTTYDAMDELATGPDASDLVYDVVAAQNGQVWVTTASSVAMFENGEWTVYEEGSGFDNRYFFEKVAVDRAGRPWVTSSRGLWTFDGLFWTLYENGDMTTTKSIAIDRDNRVWIGTLSKGVLVFENEAWTTFDRQNSELASNHVHAIAVDAGGRVWLGTEWGVQVVENNVWLTLRMDTSGLVDNDIYAVGVVGKGPESLPPREEKASGTLRGRIVAADGTPLARLAVDVCVEVLTYKTYEASPCAEQPFSRSATTDTDGTFEIAELPAGFYVVAIEEDGVWARLASGLGLGSRRVRVLAGESVYLGEVVLGGE